MKTRSRIKTRAGNQSGMKRRRSSDSAISKYTEDNSDTFDIDYENEFESDGM